MNTHSEPGIQARHQHELDQGRFLIQHCSACERHAYFPREVCPHCGHRPLALAAPSGLGRVYSLTTVHRKPEAGGDFNVSLIDLDEGVRLMSRVQGPPDRPLRIGQRVEARVLVSDGRGLLLFDAVEEGAAP